MRLAVLALVATALLAGGSGIASTSRTEIVRWSPFAATLTVKPIHAVGGCGSLGPGSEVLGDFGYRCGFGNFLADPCWRDGPGRTEFIRCAANPWVKSVDRIRVPHLPLRVGVTFGRAPTSPWGVELTDGDRCTEAQGAHDSVKLPRGRVLTVDYYCKSGIVLLRNLRRGQLWTIGSARYNAKRSRYRLLGRVTVRKAILGGLPPEMMRQHEIAHGAALAAIRFVRPPAARKHKHSQLVVFRVRLSLPAADWANVHVWDEQGSPGDWRVVLHRIDGRWLWARDYRPYCVKLPAEARRQLFDARDC